SRSTVTSPSVFVASADLLTLGASLACGIPARGIVQPWRALAARRLEPSFHRWDAGLRDHGRVTVLSCAPPAIRSDPIVYDVVVVGGGNAALCSAVAARVAGAAGVIVECCEMWV